MDHVWLDAKLIEELYNILALNPFNAAKQILLTVLGDQLYVKVSVDHSVIQSVNINLVDVIIVNMNNWFLNEDQRVV